MRLIKWLSNSVLFPLFPMLVTWFFKGVETNNYVFSNVSGTDLAFATAMICIVSIVKVRNVGSDPQLQETISTIFSVGLCFSLILFTATLLYQIQSDVIMSKFYSEISKNINQCNNLVSIVRDINPNIHSKKLETFRAINALYAFLIVITAIFCNYKYNLDRP